jgi:hypothetical protein
MEMLDEGIRIIQLDLEIAHGFLGFGIKLVFIRNDFRNHPLCFWRLWEGLPSPFLAKMTRKTSHFRTNAKFCAQSWHLRHQKHNADNRWESIDHHISACSSHRAESVGSNEI